MQIAIHNPNELPLIDYRNVKPLQGNLKDLSKANYSKLLHVLERRGFTTPLFLWKDADGTHYLMDGHQRQRVMTKADMNDDGSYDVPYVLIEADSREEAKAQLLEITSQYGTITQEGFDEFTAELPEFEYKDVNFDALQFGDATAEEEPEVVEDDAPEVDEGEPPKSKLGEVYQLGRHRLMCGDSTDADAVSELMDGNKADMVFTDPPYGMNLDTDYAKRPLTKAASEKHRGQNSYSPVIGDDEDYDPSHIFNDFSYCKQIFLWGADYYSKRLPDGGSWIVWDKKKGVEDVDYTSAEFEICWSRQKTAKKIVRVTWFGLLGTEQQDVRKRVHPTQKPLELNEWFIKKYSEPSNVIVDLFGSSGSTLIACEQTDRTCYMMELDPRYVDVIRKRYWKFIHDGDESGWEEGTSAVLQEAAA